jgi:hypothetical protein
MRFQGLVLGTAIWLLGGCPALPVDPPPPPRKAEIAIAPPHALGALAAGTDAAPHPDMTPPGGEVVEPDAPEPAPSGSAPDGGTAPPGKPPAAAPTTAPDAGMAL